MLNAIGLQANDTTIIQRVLWKGGFHVFPSLYAHITDFSALPGIPSCGPAYSSASGFMGSIGVDFQYDFEKSPWWQGGIFIFRAIRIRSASRIL